MKISAVGVGWGNTDVYEETSAYHLNGVLITKDFATEEPGFGEDEYVNDRGMDAANQTRNRR